MPRNGSGVYSAPAGTDGVANTTIESAKYNAFVADIVADANAARPIVAGGTGSASEGAARTALGVPGTGTVNTFTATQTWAKGADVASASALTLGADGNYFDITGTTAITSIVTKGAGTVVKLHFDAALTLTHHATDLVLPGGANITTAAGDEFEFTEYATGDWRCTGYALASGNAIAATNQVTTPAVLAAVSGATVGEVGTYALMMTPGNSSAYSPGQSFAGSFLRYTAASATGGGTPSGTWQLMGQLFAAGGDPAATSLFLRIA